MSETTSFVFAFLVGNHSQQLLSCRTKEEKAKQLELLADCAVQAGEIWNKKTQEPAPAAE